MLENGDIANLIYSKTNKKGDILVQQIYNFENNIKKFYTTLEQSKKIEKMRISIFSFKFCL